MNRVFSEENERYSPQDNQEIDSVLQQEKNIAEERIEEAKKEAQKTINDAYKQAAEIKALSEMSKAFCETDSYLAGLDRSGVLQDQAVESIDAAQQSSVQLQNRIREELLNVKGELTRQMDEKRDRIEELIDNTSMETVKALSEWRGGLYSYKYSKLMNAYSNLFHFATRIVPGSLKEGNEEELTDRIAELQDQLQKIRNSFDKVMVSLQSNT